MKPTSSSLRRILPWLLLAALLLNACQFSPTPPTPAPTPLPTGTRPAPTSQATPLSISSLTPTFPADVQRLNGLTVSLWHPWLGHLQSALQSEVDEFNQSNAWGLQVQIRGFGGETALQNACLAAKPGQLPTLVLGSPTQLAGLEAETGSLLDLGLLMDDSEWGLTAEEIADFLPGLGNVPQSGEQVVSLPLISNIRLLFYNLTWAKELDYARPPTTPADFKAQVCAAMKAHLAAEYSLRESGGWLLDNDAYTLLGWLEGFGAEFSNGLRFDTPQGLEAFTFLHQLVADDCTYRLTVANPEPYQPFATRRALIYAGSLADLPMQVQVSQKLQSKDEWTVIPFPAVDGRGVIPLFSQDVAILDGTHEQELGAWLFVRWLLLSRNQADLALAGGLLPVTQSGLEVLQTQSFPVQQMKELMKLTESFRPLQANAEWGIARRVLEDAGWQLYQTYTTVEDVPRIMEQLDGLVDELGGR